MKSVKPLIMVRARHAAISGGYYRTYEILKNGKLEGIDYTIVTDPLSYQNYNQMFPDFGKILGKYKVYYVSYNNRPKIDIPVSYLSKVVMPYHHAFSWATSISRIVQEEDVDLIVGPSEDFRMVLTSYFSGKLCRKPWSVIFTGTNALFQPTQELAPINLINVLRHVNRKESMKGLSLLSKSGFSIELLVLLKIAEKSLMLTVSRSLCREMMFLNPRIKFHVITPGNGVDLEKTNKKAKPTPIYDGIFFSRLVPEKGILDLPKIWKLVVHKFPKAKLAIAGVIEEPSFVKCLQRELSRYNLTKNVEFLGPQKRDSLIDLVMSSKVMVYPSILDTFSLSVLESLACGTPVVAYDVLAIKYNFHKCRGVLRCPVKDTASMAKKVISLLENEDLRVKLSKEAKEYASNFDWKKVVKAEKEAYFKVIEQFKSR